MLKQGQSQAGFSLIEVLVALVILSIGVLGVAGLQIVALAQSAESNRQGLAALHLQSAADSLLIGEDYNNVVSALNDALATGEQLGTDGCVGSNNNQHVSITPDPNGEYTLYTIEIGWLPTDADNADSEEDDDGCARISREVRVNA